MKKFFIDTEFTNFHDKGLISFGLVDMESENCFYLENKDYDRREISDFVSEIVVPLLDLNNYGSSLNNLNVSFLDWVSKFEESYCFIGDSDLDMQVLEKVLDFSTGFEGFIYVEHLLSDNLEINRREDSEMYCLMERFSDCCEEYYDLFNGRIHHALDDAQANKWAYLKLLGKI